jgi:hypothetical protein
LTRAERIEAAVVDWDRWRSKWNSPNFVLQFLGDCGHGKTTHLLALHHVIPNSIYIYLPEDGPAPEIPLVHRPLIIDEVQRMPLSKRKQLLRNGGRLIFGTHQDYANEIERFGLQCETMRVSDLLSDEHLLRVLNRRIEISRYGNSPVPELSPSQVTALRTRFGPSIRAVEHHLYEQFQSCVQANKPWPPVNS